MTVGEIRRDSRTGLWVAGIVLVGALLMLPVILVATQFVNRSPCAPYEVVGVDRVEAALGEPVSEVSDVLGGGCGYRVADAVLQIKPPLLPPVRDVELLRGFDLASLATGTPSITTADGDGKAFYESTRLGETLVVSYGDAQFILTLRSAAPGNPLVHPDGIRPKLVDLAQEALAALPTEPNSSDRLGPLRPEGFATSYVHDVCPELATIEDVEQATGFLVNEVIRIVDHPECRFAVGEPGSGEVAVYIQRESATEDDLVALRRTDLDEIPDHGTESPDFDSGFTHDEHGVVLQVGSDNALVQVRYTTPDAGSPVQPDALRPGLTALLERVIARL